MGRMEREALRQAAEQWAEGDIDVDSREELTRLIASMAQNEASAVELADRFAGSLEFGTAGLRGILGAGPNRMNRAVVIRTTHAIAKYLLQHVPDVAASQGVAIGFDGRRMSRQFAEDAACVLAAAKIRSWLFRTEVPTPLLAFSVLQLNCVCGVMVTASHNPPEYNGYKVYAGNGAQIISPVDSAIAAYVDTAPRAKEVPRLAVSEALAQGWLRYIDGSLADDYLAQVERLRARAHDEGDRSLRIVYTPLHGVGDELARRALDAAGFRDVVSVVEQQKPDGNFPTVQFPNPEEPGAMDLAFALARSRNADLVLANDPDADRLAVAVPQPSAPSGYVQLTGNQVGALLGHYLLTGGLRSLDCAVRKSPEREPLVLASIVSSPMLGVIARQLGAAYDEVLTGFKWIAARAIAAKEKSNADFVFGFEEALGYTVGELVRDKDGISAAVMFAELTAVLRSEGLSVLEHLEALYRRYGLFVSSQVNLTRKGASGIAELKQIMTRLRQNPPWEIADDPVVAIRDYEQGTITTRDNAVRTLDLPPSNVLAFELASGSRVIARPSGTEPKAKFYFDVREAVAADESLESAETRAQAKRQALANAFTALVQSLAVGHAE